jgi:hypothetical protein
MKLLSFPIPYPRKQVFQIADLGMMFSFSKGLRETIEYVLSRAVKEVRDFFQMVESSTRSKKFLQV